MQMRDEKRRIIIKFFKEISLNKKGCFFCAFEFLGFEWRSNK
jgi:hypothetical protein